MGNDPLFLNKVAAAVLSAGLLAMITGFIAHQLYHPHVPEKQAFVDYVARTKERPAAKRAQEKDLAMARTVPAFAEMFKGQQT